MYTICAAYEFRMLLGSMDAGFAYRLEFTRRKKVIDEDQEALVRNLTVREQKHGLGSLTP